MAAPGNKPQNLGATARELMSYMGRHKALFFAVAVLVAVSALANLLGTYMIRPVVDSLASGNVDALVRGVALTAAIYLVGIIAAYGYSQVMVYAAQKVLYDIRRDLFAHIQTLPLKYFDTRNRGDIMSLFTNDVDTVAEAMNNSFAMVIQSFIQIVGTLVLIFVLNWQLSLLVVVGYVAMFAYIRYSTKRSRGYFQRQQQVLGELDGYIEEMVTGQKVVKVFNHERANVSEFRNKNERLRVAGTGAQGYAASMIPAVVSISFANYALVSALGGWMALAGLTDVGALASYLVFVRQTAAPINQFTQQSNFLLSALAGAERVFAAMHEKPEVDEGPVRLERTGEKSWAWAVPAGMGVGAWGKLVPVAAGAPQKAFAAGKNAAAEKDEVAPGALIETSATGADGTVVATGRISLRGDVRFHEVDFGYTPEKLVLKGLNLFAKPGQKIAFVGSTGAGKTTITNLINRFYDVDAGEITFDGIDVKNIAKSDLRRSLGIAAGHPPLYRYHCREHPVRQLGRHRRRRAPRRADRQRRQLHPPSAAGLRHHGDLRRREPLARAAPALGDRARRRGGPTRAYPGRGHELHRHAHRDAHQPWHGPAHAGENHLRDRAPALDRARRRRHHRARAGQDRRARQPRRASRPEGPLLAALYRHARAELGSSCAERGLRGWSGRRGRSGKREQAIVEICCRCAPFAQA